MRSEIALSYLYRRCVLLRVAGDDALETAIVSSTQMFTVLVLGLEWVGLLLIANICVTVTESTTPSATGCYSRFGDDEF